MTETYEGKYIMIDSRNIGSFICSKCKKKSKGIPFMPHCGQCSFLCDKCADDWCKWYDDYMNDK